MSNLGAIEVKNVIVIDDRTKFDIVSFIHFDHMHSKVYELEGNFTTEAISDPLEAFLFRASMSLFSGFEAKDWGKFLLTKKNLEIEITKS